MPLSVKNIEEKVILFIERNNLLDKNEKVLLGLSGGPDSVFALHFLHKFRHKYKIELFALHVNHGLRNEESEDDEKFCKNLCERLNVEFNSVKIDVKKFSTDKNKSIEEAARILRYEELEKFAGKVGAGKIVTAHNMNDNAETVLLNFLKGTGISGLSGIPVKRGKIIRPFLCLTKDEILFYLKKKNLEYRTDSTNLESDFERNFLRNEVVPLIKSKINLSFEKAVFRNSRILRNTKALLSRMLNEVISNYVNYGEGQIEINLNVTGKYGIEAIPEICKKVLKDKFGFDFDFDDWEKVKSVIANQTGRKIELSKDLICVKDRSKLIFKKIEKENTIELGRIRIGSSIRIDDKELKISESDRSKIQFGNDKNKEYISGDNVSEEFIVRRWQNGDKFKPLGMNNFKKVSDFLTEIKIPAFRKKEQLVLVNNNNIVWVIGQRIDDRYKILPNTKRILELWLN